MADNLYVDCGTCREGLSARLDGEAPPVPDADLDEHLARCPSCAQWLVRATALTRSLRVRPAAETPDLTERVLESAPLPVPRDWWPRVALGAVGIAQLTLGMAQLLGVGSDLGHGHHGELAGHLFNESTAWNLALGLGLLLAALRTRTASGMLPVLGGFLLVLSVFSVQDIISGAAPLSRIISHTLLVCGLPLLYLIHRKEKANGPPPGRPDALAPETDMTLADVDEPHDGPTPSRRGRHLRPASHHRPAA